MLGLLTAITIGFNTVVLAQAQTIAPGPAAPGGPYPYGVGPGGISVAPGSERQRDQFIGPGEQPLQRRRIAGAEIDFGRRALEQLDDKCAPDPAIGVRHRNSGCFSEGRCAPVAWFWRRFETLFGRLCRATIRVRGERQSE